MSGDLFQASSLTPRDLYSGALSGAAVDTLLTAAAGQAIIVVSFDISNITSDPGLGLTSTDAAVWVALVPAGGTPDGTHRILPYLTLTAGDQVYREKPLMLGPGASLQAWSSVPGAVVVVMTGVVVA